MYHEIRPDFDEKFSLFSAAMEKWIIRLTVTLLVMLAGAQVLLANGW